MKKQEDQKLIVKINQFIQRFGTDKFALIIMFINTFTWPTAYIYPNQHNFQFGMVLIVRGAVCIIFSYFFAWYFELLLDTKQNKSLKNLIIRNLFMGVHGIVFTISQLYIPIFMVHTIAASGPLFIIIINYFLKGITITKKQAIGVAITIIGVFFVVNGNPLAALINPDYHIESKFQNYKTQSIYVMTLVSFLLVIGMIFWAYAVILTKQIKLSPVSMNLHLGYTLCGIGAFSLMIESRQLQLGQYLQSYIFSGLFFAISHFFFIISIAMYSNTGVLMTLANNVVTVSYAISIFKYNETINSFCVLGSISILLGIYKILLTTSTSQKQNKPIK